MFRKGIFPLRIGFERLTDSKVYYDELKETPLNVDHALQSGYHLYSPHYRSVLKNTGVNEPQWEVKVIKRLEDIVEEANASGNQSLEVFSQNPHLDYCSRCKAWMQLLPAKLRKRIGKSTQAIALVLIFSAFIIIILLVVCLIMLLSALVLDAFTCSCLFRGSPKEVQWIEAQMKEYPELDARLLDVELHAQMDELAKYLNKRFPNLSWNYVYEERVEEKNDQMVLYYDRFLLVVTPNSVKAFPSVASLRSVSEVETKQNSLDGSNDAILEVELEKLENNLEIV
jgi:hypothetical protein